MPHKINPIRFENAEANLELSSALLDSLAATLVTSRLQRDLTDSTTQRNIGVALGHSLLALDNLARGLGEIDDRRRPARRRPRRQLGGARRGDPDRDPRRGHRRPQLDRRPIRAAQGTHPRHAGSAGRARAPSSRSSTSATAAKARLLALTPAGYIGLADELVELHRVLSQCPRGSRARGAWRSGLGPRPSSGPAARSWWRARRRASSIASTTSATMKATPKKMRGQHPISRGRAARPPGRRRRRSRRRGRPARAGAAGRGGWARSCGFVMTLPAGSRGAADAERDAAAIAEQDADDRWPRRRGSRRRRSRRGERAARRSIRPGEVLDVVAGDQHERERRGPG